MASDAVAGAAAAHGPGDLRVFRHPPMMQRLSLFGAVFCIVTFAIVVAFAVAEPRYRHPLLIGISLATLAYSIRLSIVSLRRSRERVEADDAGIRAVLPDGSSVAIGWDEVGEVEVQNVMQRLVVVDRSGSRRVACEFHLQGFGELRRMVFDRTPAATRRSTT